MIENFKNRYSYYKKNKFHLILAFDDLHTANRAIDYLEKQLLIPHKKPKYKNIKDQYELYWEGITAKYIDWFFSEDKTIQNLFLSCNAYINDDLEIVFRVPFCISLEWAKRFQKQLPFKTTPVCHNKGKKKYYRLYIVDKNLAANMRDSLDSMV